MNNLGKIKLQPAREQVASILRKAILTGEFDEGRELIIEDVAKQIGVSSMPVREAFQILSTDGLIKLRHNKAAVVLGTNEKMIIDHFNTRALLESECCALCCKQGTDLSLIEQVYDKAKVVMENKDYINYRELNYEFHKAIWKTADNLKIISILGTMWNASTIGHRISDKEYAINSFREHTEIINIIKNNNEDEARTIMKEHILGSLGDILSSIAKNDREVIKLVADDFVQKEQKNKK